MDHMVKTNRELEVTAEAIDAALVSVRKKCVIFKWISLVSFVVLSAVGVLAFTLLAAEIGGNSGLEGRECFVMMQVGVQCILFSVFLFFVMRVFIDLGKGVSPFSRKEANRIQISGIVLVVESVIDANLPQFVELVSSSSGLMTGIVHVADPVFGVNIGSLISGIVFIGFAFILRFGALLQDVSDGTV